MNQVLYEYGGSNKRMVKFVNKIYNMEIIDEEHPDDFITYMFGSDPKPKRFHSIRMSRYT